MPPNIMKQTKIEETGTIFPLGITMDIGGGTTT